MLLLVSGATKYPRSETVGHLIVPRQNPARDALDLHPGRWAMDNGAFSGFDAGAFMRMLQRFQGKPGCLFVVAPDVVFDAAATLDNWTFWAPIVRAAGYPVAFVAQNGLQAEDVPWGEFAALFVGGDDAYKEGEEARSLCAYAKARGVWVHWGRVNGKRRYALALQAGVDSIDGTGFTWYPDTRIPMVDEWDKQIQQQPGLSL